MASLVKCPLCTTSHLPVKGDLKPGFYACTCENCGHFFKFRSQGDVQDDISVTINGTSYTVGNEYNPATSLLEYMRKTGISTGTKGCCYEGGCGVCLVTVKLLDPLTGQQRSYSINSCCLQLYTCDGLEVTTVEGLGNTRDGLHAIQDRLAKHDGVQCGYCTPGQVMNMYGLLQNNPTPTMKEVEDAFDTTICRCTGYRPILDAMKSFASDAPPKLRKKGGLIDIEELEGKLCKKSGKACSGDCKGKEKCSTDKQKGNNSAKNSQPSPRRLHIVTDVAQWFKPTSLAELYPLLKQYASQNYRLVLGNTGFGVFGEVGPWNFDILIDIRGVTDLYTVDLTPSDHIVFGSNVSLTALKEAFEQTTDSGLPYAKDFAQHLASTASFGIRNLGSWAGNVAMKNLHNDFVSDVFTILETVGAQITIADGDGTQTQHSMTEFLSLDMKGKVIVSVQLPKYSTSDVVVRTCRTSHRLQTCVAYVISGFNFQVDTSDNYLVKSKPSIVIQGISGTLVHAVQTEAFLTNKKLGDATVLQDALNTLSGEIVPASGPTLASPTYRKSLALGQFYKFVLALCPNNCTARFVSGGPDLDRPVMTGTQDYGTDNPNAYPATKAMMKLTADNLTTGEIKYVADLPAKQGQLFAAPVLSSQANAKLGSIDPSGALAIPGVVAFIKASDIPGVNDWRPHGAGGFRDNEKQELLCSDQVLYAGQPIGVVVADAEVTARSATFAVQVNYTDIQEPVLSVDDAILKQSFFPKLGPYTKGNASAAMASAPNRITGSFHCSDQYHFHLENQAALSSPTDTGGMDVMVTSQWLNAIQVSLSQLLGIKQSRINVETQRIGGAFGGKITQPGQIAGMSSIAAYVTRRPVLMNLDIHHNMQLQGKRTFYRFDYEIGFDNTGKILAIIATGYSDTGALFMGFEGSEYTQGFIDSVYFCPNWSWTVQPCKTNKPLSTATRAPGSAPAVFGMECMVDHVATYLNMDHLEVRKVNFFQNGQTTLGGMLLEHCLTGQIISQLETEANYAARLQAVNDFNRDNRWKKRGLQVMPSRYPMNLAHFTHTSSVLINSGDGSVFINHGGIDMGQGINTKVIQCCAFKLGVPIDMIEVKISSTSTSPNSQYTSGSTASELICLSVIQCCDELLTKMAASKAKLTNPTWLDIVRQCVRDMVDLRAFYMPRIEYNNPTSHYNVWGACCVEVELDVLTGQYQILQVDYLNDTGISLNPELDMGQLEGGFIMGCGLVLLEGMKFDATTGQPLTDGTWGYKPPLGKDLPIKFNSKFLRNAPNPNGVLGSKAVAEAPVASGTCVLLALKRAIEAARADAGQTGWFPLNAPATVESIQSACLNDAKDYTFGN